MQLFYYGLYSLKSWNVGIEWGFSQFLGCWRQFHKGSASIVSLRIRLTPSWIHSWALQRSSFDGQRGILNPIHTNLIFQQLRFNIIWQTNHKALAIQFTEIFLHNASRIHWQGYVQVFWIWDWTSNTWVSFVSKRCEKMMMHIHHYHDGLLSSFSFWNGHSKKDCPLRNVLDHDTALDSVSDFPKGRFTSEPTTQVN